MPRRLLAVVAALLVTLTACGDDAGSPGATSAGEEREDTGSESDADDGDGGDDDGDGGEGACALLDDDTVSDLLGRDVEDGEEEDLGADATVCTWATEEPSAVVGEPITLTVERGPLDDEVTTAVDALLADEANEELELGDRSVLVCGLGADGDACGSFDEVVVELGDHYLEVDLGNWGYPDDYAEDEGLQIALDAAEQAVDALG